MNAPAKIEEAPAPVVAEPTSLLDAIIRVASDPNTDVDKFERLMAVHERMAASAASQAYTAALADLQPKLPVINETGGITNNSGAVQSTYATWEDINDVIKPLIAEHGFALSFRPGVAPDGKVTVTAILSHRTGHKEEATVTLPQDSSGNKNGVQAVGSSLSYGKRYAAIAILNITSRAKTDRDDDGQAAGQSDACRQAFTEINVAEGLGELRAWKTKNFDGLSKLLSASELRGVIELYNRRVKHAKAAAAPKEGQTNG